MIANRKIGFLIFLSLLLFGTTAAGPKPSALIKAVFESREFHQRYGSCTDSNYNCINVEIYYPEIISTPSENAKDSINKYIKDYILRSSDDTIKPKSLDEVGSILFEEYSEILKNMGIYPAWEYKDSGWVASDTCGILSVAFDYFGYFGGAHPGYGRSFFNFDIYSGKRVRLEDILTKGYKVKFSKVAEQRFKEVKQLPLDIKLTETGFWFQNDNFPIDENYSISNQGVVLYYNPYEIGPSVEGSTELLIKYEEIEYLIDEKDLLKRQPR